MNVISIALAAGCALLSTTAGTSVDRASPWTADSYWSASREWALHLFPEHRAHETTFVLRRDRSTVTEGRVDGLMRAAALLDDGTWFAAGPRYQEPHPRPNRGDPNRLLAWWTSKAGGVPRVVHDVAIEGSVGPHGPELPYVHGVVAVPEASCAIVRIEAFDERRRHGETWWVFATDSGRLLSKMPIWKTRSMNEYGFQTEGQLQVRDCVGVPGTSLLAALASVWDSDDLVLFDVAGRRVFQESRRSLGIPTGDCRLASGATPRSFEVRSAGDFVARFDVTTKQRRVAVSAGETTDPPASRFLRAGDFPRLSLDPQGTISLREDIDGERDPGGEILDVAIDRADLVYAITADDRVVRAFDRDGQVVSRHPTGVSVRGKPLESATLAVDDSGGIVLDSRARIGGSGGEALVLHGRGAFGFATVRDADGFTIQHLDFGDLGDVPPRQFHDGAIGGDGSTVVAIATERSQWTGLEPAALLVAFDPAGKIAATATLDTGSSAVRIARSDSLVAVADAYRVFFLSPQLEPIGIWSVAVADRAPDRHSLIPFLPRGTPELWVFDGRSTVLRRTLPAAP